MLRGPDIASKFTNCIESHAHVHLIPTNQPPFFINKVQRDSEPGGHDARDRDGADQLDLPHHLRPRHLPAVQPPSLLWRISGEKKLLKPHFVIFVLMQRLFLSPC